MKVLVVKVESNETPEGIIFNSDMVIIGQELYCQPKIELVSWTKDKTGDSEVDSTSWLKPTVLVSDKISGGNLRFLPTDILSFKQREATEAEVEEWVAWQQEKIRQQIYAPESTQEPLVAPPSLSRVK